MKTTPITESLRERKKRDTRERIAASALALLGERGLPHTTVEQICAAADVSQRTFFNYFPTKAAAVLGLPSATVDDDLKDRFLTGTGTLLDDVIALVTDIAPTVYGRKSHLRAIIHDHPELHPTMMQWANELRDNLNSLIAERSDVQTADAIGHLVMWTFGEVATSTTGIEPGEMRTRIRSRLEELAALLQQQLRA